MGSKRIRDFNEKFIEIGLIPLEPIQPLRFDFYIEWNDSIILIEVDGMQHFYESTWTTKEKLKEIQIRDNIKARYCVEQNYTLVRIPY